MARASAKSVWTVAFDPRTGDHLSYDPGHVYDWDGDNRKSTETQQLIPTFEFDATLTFVRFERGRSSATAIFRDEGKMIGGWPYPVKQRSREWTMFLAEFERLVPNIKFGRISGRWGFEKNGANTGIVRVS